MVELRAASETHPRQALVSQNFERHFALAGASAQVTQVCRQSLAATACKGAQTHSPHVFIVIAQKQDCAGKG